jgi:hypothetical protein
MVHNVLDGVADRGSAPERARPVAPAYRSSLLAGVLAGTAGLLTFLVIMPMGLVVAAGGGAAVGWAYGEIGRPSAPRLWTAAAVVGLAALILAPSIIAGELRGPLFVMVGGEAELLVSVPEVALRFVVELLLTATVAGALAGWWLGRSRRAAAATALAGFIFALGPGHNIPFIAGSAGVGKELMIMVAVLVASSTTLVASDGILRRVWS